MDYGMRLEHTQKLIMTPELRQAITILQLSSLELTGLIEQELLENPALELQEDALNQDEEMISESKNDVIEQFLALQEHFGDGRDLGFVNSSKSDERQPFEQFVSYVMTLYEHLKLQLRLSGLRDTDQKIGEYIIDCLNQYGYLQFSLAEIAEAIKITEAEAQEILRVIQTFEPSGVGARDLKECLVLQLDALAVSDEVIRKIVSNHLSDLAGGKIQRIAQSLDVGAQIVQKAIDFIKTLEPKPGRKFADNEQARYIIPDVTVERVEGDYVVLVNEGVVPRLTVNPDYGRLANSDQLLDHNTREFIKNKMNSALWFVKNIEQRRQTLYKVASCLVEMQRDFLDKGIKYIKPMTLKQIAARVSMHESTVSRASHNKYIQTPQGTFPMRYFFTSSIEKVGGGEVSATSVKQLIEKLIKEEDLSNPHSDQNIGDLLSKFGYKLARRTVAKYREELGIPSSARRKRY